MSPFEFRVVMIPKTNCINQRINGKKTPFKASKIKNKPKIKARCL
jgi:hypothetical protein